MTPELGLFILMVVLGLLGGIAGTVLTIIYDPKTLGRLNKMAGRSDLQ